MCGAHTQVRRKATGTQRSTHVTLGDRIFSITHPSHHRHRNVPPEVAVCQALMWLSQKELEILFAINFPQTSVKFAQATLRKRFGGSLPRCRVTSAVLRKVPTHYDVERAVRDVHQRYQSSFNAFSMFLQYVNENLVYRKEEFFFEINVRGGVVNL